LILSILSLGFLMGMRHALEADHVAAVASIASRRQGIRAISRHGVFWGFGHTLTLLVVGGTAILLKVAIDDRLATALEFTGPGPTISSVSGPRLGLPPPLGRPVSNQ
jgi:high-affinity nickel permease